MGEPALKLDTNTEVKFMNAFLTGTIKTFTIQCNYEMQAQKSYLLKPNDPMPIDICGVIGLTSNVFRGAISLCFTEKLFLAVMGSMFQEKFDTVTDELADGAGELINIIFGTAKTILTSEGYTVEKALPTIIRGKEIKVSSLSRGKGPTIVVPFVGKDGTLNVLINLDEGK